MTDKPFGVNLTLLPAVTPPDYPGLVKTIVESGVKVVETAGNNAARWLPPLKDAGIEGIHKCTSVRHSLKAQSIGCDAVSVDGFECGGHPGEDDVPNFILLPRAADELEIPLVASGGMADGRSLVAALAMGAEGMNMGTRFIATKEAPVHENVKRALGANLKFEDIAAEVAGVYPRVMTQGDMEAGAWSCGMVAGLIYDIPTVRELVDRIMADAERIIRERLTRLASA